LHFDCVPTFETGILGAYIFGQYRQHFNNSFCVSGKGQIGAMLPHPFCVYF